MDLLVKENMLAKLARSNNVYLIKSRDDVLTFWYEFGFEPEEEGAIEIKGKNYYQDSNYLLEGPKEKGEFKYAVIKFIEDTPFSVKIDGNIVRDYCYSSKNPSISGFSCIVCEYDLDEIGYILTKYQTEMLEKPKYYGYVQSIESAEPYGDVLFQLYVLQDYARRNGIEYEKIFGVYNLPEDSDLEEVNFNNVIQANFKELKEIRPKDVVCTVNSIIPDCDGGWEYEFIEKNIFEDWLFFNGLKDYRLLKK